MIQIIADVLRFSKAEGIDKLILICIANYSNHDNEAWPSVKTLARDAGVAERSVHYHINHLIEIGELQKIENPQRRSNTYCIVCTQRVQEMHTEGANGAPTPVQGLQTNQSYITSHLTKKQFSLEDAKALPLPASLQTPTFVEAWNNLWLPHRFSHHSGKPTQLVIEQTIKRCEEWGPDKSVRLIKVSVAGGWQAIHDNEQRFSKPQNGNFFDPDYPPGTEFYVDSLGRRRVKR